MNAGQDSKAILKQWTPTTSDTGEKQTCAMASIVESTLPYCAISRRCRPYVLLQS
jgi:hypothetical protein